MRPAKELVLSNETRLPEPQKKGIRKHAITALTAGPATVIQSYL
jgi:hypothetical protein